MESKRTWEYIFFGTTLRYLQDATPGRSVHGYAWILWNLEQFFENLDELNLAVTRRAAYRLKSISDRLAETPADSELTVDDASELRKAATELRETLMAEAEGKLAYIVSDKRIDVNRLVGEVSSLFGKGVYANLPEIARHDFDEAGKCTAFERPTAAAFHLLRGTESVLRQFYRNTVKRNRVKPLLWKAMVDSLRARRSPPSEALLDNLDNIRRSFRNPTQHPDKIYDIDEAQDLFGLCIDVVNRMTKA